MKIVTTTESSINKDIELTKAFISGTWLNGIREKGYWKNTSKTKYAHLKLDQQEIFSLIKTHSDAWKAMTAQTFIWESFSYQKINLDKMICM